MTSTKKVLACMLLVLIVFSLAACAATPAIVPAEAKTLKIGSVLPLSGPGAQWGLLIRPVIEMYADEVNKDGGVKVGDETYKIELYFADGPLSPAADAAAARSLVYDKKVKAIVGYISIGYSAIAAITTPEKVIFNSSTIVIGAYNPKTEPYSLFGFPAAEAGVNQALVVMDAFPQNKVLCWTGPKGGNAEVEKIYGPVDEAIEKEYGIKSVRLYYPEGTTNFTPYVTKMAEMGVDTIYSYANPIEMALLAKSRYQMGYNWPIAQNGSLVELSTLKAMVGSQEAMQNICGNYNYPWALKKAVVSPKYLDIANRIRATYKESHNNKEPYPAFGSAGSMGHYLEGVQLAGTTDPDKVMAALRGGTIETFLGRYTLSGAKAYGSPVVVGWPCAMGIIKGTELSYLGEKTLNDVDHPVGGVSMIPK